VAERWELIAVLPNLPLDRSWDCEPFAFVPQSDKRLPAIRRRTRASRALLQNFSDAFGRRIAPAALIIRGSASTQFRQWDVIVDLRNAFAIASICGGWQKAIGNPNIWWPLYADYFDFYSLLPDQTGNGLVNVGPGSSSYDNADKFNGQPQPDLGGSAPYFKAEPDETLLNVLVVEWEKRAKTKRRSWRNRALFRSLAVAFRAARLPKGSDNELFDLGIQLSLWVSAHECLAHPGRRQSVSLEAVWTLLSRRVWGSNKLRRRSRCVRRPGKLTPPLNYVQKLYFQMYRARNAFLHGNPVGANQVFLGITRSDSLFIKVAPLVFQSALEASLGQPSRPRRSPAESIADSLRFRALERALLKTKEPRRIRVHAARK
jgi:hypothetical protein